jgi:SpoVK/Ycf46/Vps4 family AAA+-type ATPase
MGSKQSTPSPTTPVPTPVIPTTSVMPNYSMAWNSKVIGMVRAKRCLDAALSLPAKFPTFCQGTPSVRSVLLWGPPGTGM